MSGERLWKSKERIQINVFFLKDNYEERIIVDFWSGRAATWTLPTWTVDICFQDFLKSPNPNPEN